MPREKLTPKVYEVSRKSSGYRMFTNAQFDESERLKSGKASSRRWVYGCLPRTKRFAV